MADITKAKFELDKKGLAELCKSPEMQALLGEHAEKMAARANILADERQAHVSEFHTPPYAASVDVLDNTAVGVAFTNSKIGAYIENQHKWLSCQAH